jgi:hypothetical protein
MVNQLVRWERYAWTVVRSIGCLSHELLARCVVDAVELDQVLTARLVVDASEAISGVALELASLYDSWLARGDSPEAVAWMARLLEQLGWWAGRLDCAADPLLVAKFPRLD